MYNIVFVTVPSLKVAGRIATAIVQGKLAACVNIVPAITSIYKWEGKLYRDKELLLIIKTRKTLFYKLADKIKNLHPYKIPEIIAMPISKGYKPYLDWIGGSVSSGAYYK